MVTLFFIQTIDMFGDAIVELKADDLELGILTIDDAEDMATKGYEPTEEADCIAYAKKEKGFLIPDEFIITCIYD